MQRMLVMFGCVVASFFAVGCSDEGAGRLAVKGTVTFQNTPLDKGNIQFEKVDKENPHRGGATIEAGRFAIPRNQGLKPGTYLVRISAADATQKEENQAPGDSRQLAKDRIPPEWNTNSTQKIEVKDGSTEFTFDIK